MPTAMGIVFGGLGIFLVGGALYGIYLFGPNAAGGGSSQMRGGLRGRYKIV